jgi:hypothetical protein
MARKIIERPPVTKPLLGIMTPTCDYIMERVTRIELALSAWEVVILLPRPILTGLPGSSSVDMYQNRWGPSLCYCRADPVIAGNFGRPGSIGLGLTDRALPGRALT